MKIKRITLLVLVLLLGSCKERLVPGIHDEGGVPVIELCGTWAEMGHQYGILASPYLHDVMAYISSRQDGREDKMAEARDIAEKLYSNYPEKYKEFLEASAKSSGLGMDDIKLCNAVEYIEGTFFCSAIATWDDYSRDKLIFGRNYDAISYSEISNDIIITVFHPDGEMSAATIGYAGELYCVNGINEKGIFLELNNGMPSAGFEIDWSICPSTTQLMSLIFSAKTMDDAEYFFQNTPSSSSFIIGACNKDEARAYEWCRDGMKRGDEETPDGLMVNTNHYVHQEWKYDLPSNHDSWDSITRRTNLLEAALTYKGSMTIEKMQSLMSTTIEEGGPFSINTRYQLVYVPEDMSLFINTPALTDPWVEIKLAKYLITK